MAQMTNIRLNGRNGYRFTNRWMMIIPPDMSRHMSFIGQRADKAVVVDVAPADVEDVDGVIKGGVVKDIRTYTVSCDECGNDGYYDQRGEIICDGCGMVLSGERPAVIQTEYSNKEGDSTPGKGRGVGDLPAQASRGTLEPSQDTYG